MADDFGLGFPQNLAVSSCAVIDLLLTFGSRAPSPAASTAKPAEVAASGAPSAFQASTPGARLASQAGFEVTGPALASTTPGSTVFSSLTRLNLAEHAGSFTGGSVARTRSTSCSESLFEPVRLLSSGLRGEPVSWAATACAPLGCTQAQLGLAAPLNVRQACRAADDSAPLYQTSDLAAMVASRGFPPRQLERLESVVSSDVDGKRELETEVEEEEETTEKAVKAQRVEIEEDQVEEDELLRSGGAERREEDVKVIAKSKECVNEEEMDWAQRFRLKYSQTEVPERLASELIKPGLLGLDTASQLRPSKIGCDLGAITATAPAYAATFTDSESNKGACHNKDRKGIVEDSGLELIVNQTNSEKSLEEATDNCLELRPPGGLDDYCDLYGYGNYAEHCA
ncbi:unnamed protein product [Protopolystoma xenopodis]|uniref:Uncharacterized protein n=1 Tax=Protopolystoma xenopodis TaxID=117903 RepID=A0A3S5CIK4_9PLAT|nr:unnamed protein product [Protopolystoma xenopodis]